MLLSALSLYPSLSPNTFSLYFISCSIVSALNLSCFPFLFLSPPFYSFLISFDFLLSIFYLRFFQCNPLPLPSFFFFFVLTLLFVLSHSLAPPTHILALYSLSYFLFLLFFSLLLPLSLSPSFLYFLIPHLLPLLPPLCLLPSFIYFLILLLPFLSLLMFVASPLLFPPFSPPPSPSSCPSLLLRPSRCPISWAGW